MHPRRSALLRATASAVVAAVLTTSCSGDAGSSEARPDTPSSSPATPASDAAEPSSGSPEPDAVEPTGPEAPPAPQPPRFRPGPEGQRAFARHVVASWAWALRTNDAEPLVEAGRSAKRPCAGCRELSRELRRRERDRWYVDLPAVSVDRTRLRRNGQEIVATARIDLPESDTYFYDGGFRSTSPAHDDATFVVRMRKARDRYVLTSFTVG